MTFVRILLKKYWIFENKLNFYTTLAPVLKVPNMITIKHIIHSGKNLYKHLKEVL